MYKDKSYMLGIPVYEDDVMDLDIILNRLNNSQKFTLLSTDIKDNIIKINVEYKNSEYEVEISPSNFTIPQMYIIQHYFPDIDIEQINETKIGIEANMTFNENSLNSYHLQLKLIDEILPEKLAVLDYSSEKILSGKWVEMAAKSNIPPAPRYIYTAQAVSGEDTCVWIHTHGLNRCGISELEVLDSKRDTYSCHYNIIETMANRFIENNSSLEFKKPMYLGNLSEDILLVTTIIPWEEAVNLYDENMLGGKKDREYNHNKNTSVVFLYESEENCESENYTHISIYDEILQDNPLYMLTNFETSRMRALAIERINYLETAFLNKENKILVKLGLEIDEEYKSENNSKEHIWFELKEFSQNILTAELTQEPYYIKDVHTGYTGNYNIEDITDWIIFTPEKRISPDDAYLLEHKF